MTKEIFKSLSTEIPSRETMTKSPTNGTATNKKLKLIQCNRQSKKKENKKSTSQQVEMKKTINYEGIKGFKVKQEEMKKPVVDRTPSPKRKREVEVIVSTVIIIVRWMLYLIKAKKK